MSEKPSSVVTGEQRPPQMCFPNRSVNGIGIMLYGGKPLSPTTFEVTRWITILAIPLVPLSTWEIEPTAIEEYSGTKRNFNVVANRPLNIKHVLLAYLFSVLAVVPTGVIWIYTPYWSNLPVVVGMLIWILSFPVVALYRHYDIYKKAR